MNPTKNALDFFKESDTYDPITFFTWMGYQYQNDKSDAHSTYQILLSKAKDSIEWKADAVLMAEEWQRSQTDGTIASFWRKLPKKSSRISLTRAQNDQAISNAKRLYKRDNIMSEIWDKGLVEEVESQVASASLLGKKKLRDVGSVSTSGPVVSTSTTTATASISSSSDVIGVAGQKHPRDPWGDQNEASSGTHSPSPGITQAIVDLEEAEEDLDELQSAEIATCEHPFFPIFRALYDLHHHRPFITPPCPPNLTGIQRKLFAFIVSKLPRFHLLKRVQKKDILRRPWEDALDQLAPLIVDEAFSATDDQVKAILDKVEKPAMLSNRKVDPKRARLYATKELGSMASSELNGVMVDDH
ncbi:hypothetical protein BGZ96_001776 [Linnemannia gamsii]|uniref:Uncharacterized protein n=1 Tax=Linnemannia gamsii TaxID=64522 RepID=A0ABQ7JMP7_9FUNG|nr:hypothetical protein BGZ96_001776 [Linnemannia gamsii]